MTAATAGASGKATRVRFLILALLTLGTMINYLDRTVISVAAPSMSKELGLNAAIMGVVFSAFSWTYAAAQIPGGIFLDRVGARLTYFLSVTIWSGFTILQGFAGGLTSLIAYRLGLGIAEAPCYPTNSRVLSIWFPQAERARATSVLPTRGRDEVTIRHLLTHTSGLPDDDAPIYAERRLKARLAARMSEVIRSGRSAALGRV